MLRSKFQNIYIMTSRSSYSWLLSAFPVDTPSFVLLNTSSHSVRCRFVHVSIFLAIFCSIILVALLVVSPCCCPYKQPYFDRMGSCKLLSTLSTEFPPAHVSFTQFFSIYIWYKFPIFYCKFSILYRCCRRYYPLIETFGDEPMKILVLTKLPKVTWSIGGQR